MKLFSRTILSLIAITAVAPLAFGQTPLYYQGGRITTSDSTNVTGPGDENFNTPSNWSTVPPSTFLTGTTSNTYPQANNIAVIQADLNNGTVFYSSANSAFLSGNTATPVVINQTSQGNTVAGFLVSNYGFVGQGSGTVNFTNTSGQAFVVNPATSVSTGDFVVDGGVTLNYAGGPFVVANGRTVIGDDSTFQSGSNPNNTIGGSGTFNIQSGVFTYDATGTTTSMIVGYSQTSASNTFFGAATGTVTQGAPAIAAGTNPVTPATPATASTVVLGSSLILGYNSGTGSWSVTNGSSLATGTAASQYLIALGSNGGPAGLNGLGSKGTLTISDNSGFAVGTVGSAKATDLQLGTISVGAGGGVLQGGTGAIVQNGVGSTVNLVGMATTVEIGDLGGGTGTYTLSDGTLNIGVNASDDVAFVLGATVGSKGTLTQTGGVINFGNATVANGSTFVIGGAGAGTGVFTVTGGSDTFNNDVLLNGTLNVNGGTFTIDQAKLTGAGTLNLGGGTLKFTGTTGSTTENYGFAGTLTGGTSTIDVSSSNITTFNFTNSLAGPGGLDLVGNNVVGAGTTVFNFAPAGNTYTGSTGISGGTLNATGEDLSHAAAGTVLSFGTPATAASTILNLTVDANTTLSQAVTGSGQFNIIFTANNTQTLTLANTSAANSTVNVAIGATGGNAGTFQVLGGTFGTVVDNGTGSNVVIGGGGSSGTVTFGATNYSGLTTVMNPATFNAPNLQGSLFNAGTVNVTNNIGSSAANTVTNTGVLTAGNIVGDVTNNTGVMTVAGAAGLAGNVLANSGTLTVLGAAGITGNVMNSGTVIDSAGIGGNVINSGTLSATSALSMTNSGFLQTAVPLTNFAITNDFTQSAGGTFKINIAGAQSDSFTAATATLSGTVRVTGASLSTTTPTVYNIVTTTGLLTDPGLVTQNSFLLDTSLAVVPNGAGDILQLSVRTNPFVGSTPNQQALANSLNATPNNPITIAVSNNPNLTAADEPGILQSLIPENLQYATFINIENVTYLVQRYGNMTADLRNGNGGLDTNAISVSMPGFQSGMGRSLSSFAYNDPGFHQAAPNGVNYYPGEAGRSSPSPSAISDSPQPATFDSSSQVISDSPNPYLANVEPGSSETPRLNEFIGGDVVLADLNQNPTSNANDKSNYTAGGVTAGVSYRVTNHFAAGVLFDYNHTDEDFDTSGSKTKIDSYTPGIFATYFDHGFYANGLFAVGLNDYKYTSNTFLGQTTGNPTGEQYTGDLDAGYDFHPSKNWIVGPTAGLTYTHVDIDSFTEDGAPGAALNVDSQSVDSLRSRLGGHVVFQTNTGDVLLQPNLSVMWQHEYLNDSQGITSSFANTSLNPFTIQTAAPSRDSALISLGMTATLNNSMALYLNYMADVGASNFFSQSVMGGLKARF
jgi:uncharacterized protein YhjY with autotransporter beta-barrel domain